MAFKALGEVEVVTHGTAIPVYSGTNLIRCREITIQADSANTKNVYVGDRTLVVSTEVGLAATLAPGQAFTISSGGTGFRLNPEEVFIDTDVDGESAEVSLA